MFVIHTYILLVMKVILIGKDLVICQKHTSNLHPRANK